MIGTSRSVWGFDPRSVPGCQLWLDAADSSTITFSSGSNVSSWADKSGNGRNGTSTGSPTLSSGQIVFSGSQWFSGSITNTSANLTAFVVAKTTTSPATQHSRILSASAGGNDFDNTPSMDVMVYVDTANTLTSFRNLVTLSTVTTTPNQTFLAVTKTNATTNTFYLNGTASSTVTLSGGAVGSFGYTTYWVGSGPTGANLTGTISEVLYYHADLTTSERQQIEGYLAHKWGLTGYYDSSIPLTIPGCQLWLDGADPAASGVVPSAGTLSTWVDKSGNGRNATTAAGTPTFALTPSRVTFNGSSWYSTTLSSIPTAESIFIVSSTTNDSSGGQGLIGCPASPLGGRSLFQINNEMRYSTRGIANRAFNTNALINGNLFTTSVIFGGTNSQMFINGLGGTVNTSTSFSGSGTTSIGSLGGNDFYIGSIYEVIIFNTTLTTTQRQTIEGYLSKKWGIGSSMIPSTHPFSSIRPHLRTFQPIDVPGCQLWLDAADASTVTVTNGTVTNVMNKGNTSITLSNASGFTYDSTNMAFSNATSSPSFNLGKNSTYTQTQPGTLFAVAAFSSAVSNPHIIDSLSTQIDVGRFMYSILRNEANTANIAYVFAGNLVGPDFGLRTQSDIPPNNRTLHTLLMNSTSSDVRINGITQTWSQNPGTNSMTGITVANRYSGNHSWVGTINEILLFNRGLTLAERQQVEGYLAHKWGLSPSLPVISPLSIPGCQLWLDGVDPAGNGVQPSNGATVSTWVDKSGNAKNATATGTPTYLTGGGVNFNGSSYFLNQTFSMNLSQRSVFIVFQETSRTQYAGIFILIPTLPERFDQSQTTGLSYSTTDNSFQAYGNNSYGLYIGNANPLPKAIYNEIMNITAGSGYLNGTNTTNVTATYTAGTCSGYGLACRWQDGSVFGSLRLNGVIHEVIVFNTPLNTSQRQQIEGYLARKWGISISATLPSTHPFKSFPPATLPFSPRNISGLALWLDAADQSSMTLSGSNVTQWNDKSGIGNNAVANTGTVTTNSTIINGLNTIRFSANSFLNIASFAMAANVSMFAVLRGVGAQGIGNFGYFFIGNGIEPSFFIYTLQPSFGNISGHYSSLVASTGETAWYMPSSDFFLNNPGLMYIDNNVSFVNGSQLTRNPNRASVPNPVSATTYTNIRIGGRINGDSLAFDFAELLFYNNTLTTSQRQQVEGYLAQKWGLITSLPATHPYVKLPA